jgi:hypothetical protein
MLVPSPILSFYYLPPGPHPNNPPSRFSPSLAIFILFLPLHWLPAKQKTFNYYSQHVLLKAEKHIHGHYAE